MNTEKCLEILGKTFKFGNTEELSSILHNNCTYHSDYSSKIFNSAAQILESIRNVYSNLDDDSKYNYKIIDTKDILYSQKLPDVNATKCMLLYQYDDCIASVVTVNTNVYNEITHIELSRDKSLYNVDFYDDTIKPDSPNDTPQTAFDEADNSYIWKNAHSFIKNYLRENDYITSESIPFEDCIGYRCNRYCEPYTVFMFAYGQKQTIPMDGEFCRKLKSYNFAKNSTILVVYLNVKKKKKGHKYDYHTYRYSGDFSDIELWELKYVNGNPILVYYPRKELEIRTNELIYAYNNDSLDVYDMIITEHAPKFETGTGIYMNDAFFSSIKHFHEEHGDMKVGYVRFNDVIYSRVPYIKNVGYFSFSVDNNNYDKISNLCFTYFNDDKRAIQEFIETDELPDFKTLDLVPTVTKIELPPIGETERFTMKLHFFNGERKKFYLPINLEDDVIDYSSYVFTDKIWSSAHISSKRQKPHKMQYSKYPECGHGIDFINGYSISNIRCYYESFPYFDCDNRAIKIDSMRKFSVDRYDYENGYAVSYIPEFASLCLIDKNNKTIKKLPEKYQNTPIYIYPPCGGLDNGLIMVNALGKIDLQYDHNLYPCSGLWGWLDLDFNTVIEPKYIFAQHFCKIGRAHV